MNPLNEPTTGTTLTVTLANGHDLHQLFLRGGAHRRGRALRLSKPTERELIASVEQQTGGKVTRVYYEDRTAFAEVAC